MNTSAFSGRASGATALLVGSTGLVGGHLLSLLAQDDSVAQVRALVRRPLTLEHLLPKPAPAGLDTAKVDLPVADFEQLAAHPSWFAVDRVFCALGTTMKQAGSQAAFRRVDFDYPLQVARLAKAQGARHFLLVSAAGAQPRSPVFYSRVKGELEEALRALDFESLTIARPSVLVGERQDIRLGETIALRLGFLTPARYKPVQAWQVAQGLVRAGREGRPGVRLLDNIALRRLKSGDMG